MHISKAILILASLSGAVVAYAESPPTHPLPPQVVGGWTGAQVDAEARKVARFALPHLHRGRARIRSVDAVDTQVVAGTNYRVLMTLTDGSRWQVVVWKRLDKRYRFTSKLRVRT